MAWSRQQKALVHIYKAAAGLPEPEYRALIRVFTPRATAADPALTQRDFDAFMARVERALDWRVAEGVVPMPAGGRIRDLSHWRRRWEAIEAGQANSRLIHELHDWWYKLQPYLPAGQRTADYLRGIASRACRCPIPGHMTELKSWQAGLVIEALKDRLRWALKSGPQDPPVAASMDGAGDAIPAPAPPCPAGMGRAEPAPIGLALDSAAERLLD